MYSAMIATTADSLPQPCPSSLAVPCKCANAHHAHPRRLLELQNLSSLEHPSLLQGRQKTWLEIIYIFDGLKGSTSTRLTLWPSSKHEALLTCSTTKFNNLITKGLKLTTIHHSNSPSQASNWPLIPTRLLIVLLVLTSNPLACIICKAATWHPWLWLTTCSIVLIRKL